MIGFILKDIALMGKKQRSFYKAIEIAKNETKIAITLSDSFCVDRHRSDFISLLIHQQI